jgi:single-strand DNA-binding protein
MLNLNRAQIIGNLTRDPEMRYTPNGQAVTNFTVATNRRWTTKEGEAGEATEYHDIVVWGKQAETLTQILKKGAPAYVEGRLQTRNWEGQDGVKRYKTEIIADLVIALSGRGDGTYVPKDSNPMEEIADLGKDSNKKDKKSADDQTSKADDLEEIDIEEIPF